MTSSAGRSERTSPLPAPAKGPFAPILRGKKRKRQTFFKKALAIARKMWYHTQVDTTSGRLAQLVEHLLDVQEVTGSSPVPSTIQFVLEPDSLRERVRVRFLFARGSAEGLLRTVNRNEQRQDTTITVTPCLLCYKVFWGRSLRTKCLKPLCLLRSAQRSAPLWRRTCHPHKQTLSRCPPGRAVPPAHNGA